MVEQQGETLARHDAHFKEHHEVINDNAKTIDAVASF
jgi:hypothetical protein